MIWFVTEHLSAAVINTDFGCYANIFYYVYFGVYCSVARANVCRFGECVYRYPLRHNLNYLAIWMKAMQHQNFPLSLMVVSFLVRMTSMWDKRKRRNGENERNKLEQEMNERENMNLIYINIKHTKVIRIYYPYKMLRVNFGADVIRSPHFHRIYFRMKCLNKCS